MDPAQRVGGRAQRIDYIFFRPTRGPIELRCKRLEIFFDKPLGLTTHLDGTAAWASDHYGLSATFECVGCGWPVGASVLLAQSQGIRVFATDTSST